MSHSHGHNHGPASDHLHSHPHVSGKTIAKDDLVQLAEAFIEGFRDADDKTSFLRLANIPFEVPGRAGAPSLKLVDATVSNGYQIGTAAPGFGSDDLVYMPYPGSMVRARTQMVFTYVSLRERRDLNLMEHLARLHR